MTSHEIIDSIESLGGALLLEGSDRIRLRAPVEVPSEIRDYIRQHKTELLDILCPHAHGCPHSMADFFAEYRRAGKLRIEYDGNAVWLVRTEETAATIKDGTFYTISEWQRLTELSDDEIRLMHSLRTVGGPGGSIEVKGKRD